MDRIDYQMLRFSIESTVLSHVGHESDKDVVSSIVDDCMRSFVRSVSLRVTLKQRRKREFVTFRRSPDVKPPSWAYRKPGIDSRLPTLKG